MQEDPMRALFPNLTADELRIAVENFDRFLLLAWEIMQDSESVPDAA